jgi:L-aminopeptidase/D-esterase-like protein
VYIINISIAVTKNKRSNPLSKLFKYQIYRYIRAKRGLASAAQPIKYDDDGDVMAAYASPARYETVHETVNPIVYDYRE